MVTSSEIKNDTIRSRDVHNGTLGERDMNGYTVGKINQPGPRGPQGPQGKQGPEGPPGTAKYDGANWSIIDRNTIGNGDAFLRAGPSYVDSTGTVKPPTGIGSLGLRTGSGTDKADFGDQVDFAGQKVSDLQTLKYSVFTTGENNQVSSGNLPNLTFEIDPNLDNNGSTIHYTSLVYVPAGQDPGWKEHNASEDTTNGGTSGWYFTGSAGTATQCTQASLCTLADAKSKVPNGTILTAGISKGRDNAFSGAVDDLVVNDTMYNFEPLGVTESAAPSS